MRLQKFEYLAPKTLDEAFSMLSQNKDKARVMAGGTDLLVKMKDRLVTCEQIIGLKNIDGLDYVEYDEKMGLRIGALATLDSVANSSVVQEKYPIL